MERRPATELGTSMSPFTAFSRQRDILLIVCTAGWTAFVCEAVFLLIMVATPSPQPVARAGDQGRQPVAQGPVQTVQPVAPKPTPTPATPTRNPESVTPASAMPPADEANPYTATKANVLGLTVDEPTTIVLDAVEKSEPWLDGVKAALVAGLSKDGPPVELLVLQNGKIQRWNAKPQTTGANRQAGLRSFLGNVKAEGDSGFWPAVDAGVKGVGERFIFITPRSTRWADIVNRLDQHLDRGNGQTRLEVVQLGESVPELQAFVLGANRGRYTVVDDATLRGWSQ